MYISRLELVNFRNHQHLVLEDVGKILVIIGNNATGKTNIIEALQLISMHESFRKPKPDDLLNRLYQKPSQARIIVEVQLHGSSHIKQLSCAETGRTFLYNGKERPGRDLVDLLPSVLFTPDDLQLIKGPPEQRRDLLDSLGSRLSQTFRRIRAEYYKALRHKNSMLRYGTTYAASSAELEKEEIYKRSLVGTNITSNTTGVDRQLLDSWNVHLAKLGSSLYKHRLGLFEQLITIASDSYHSISGGEKLSGFYKAAWLQDEGCLRKVGEDTHGVRDVLYQQDGPDGSSDSDVLYQVLSQHAEAECAAKRSLTGPHRDDVNFTIDGHDARRFASQGQQRSIALALKIAEMEVLRRISGKNPLLLLDDVMSELDTERRAYFIDLIGEASQVVLTTTHLGYFNDDFLRRATVVELTGEGNYKGEGCP